MGLLSWMLGRSRGRHPSDDDGKLDDEHFDDDSTIFLSPRLPVTAQQSLKKLREFSDTRVLRYNWDCGPGADVHCRKVQAAGPYEVDEGLAGSAPVPGIGEHQDCDCLLVPVAE